MRWLSSRLDLSRRREGRRWVCGAQYWRQRSSAVSGDLRCGSARHRRAADTVVIRGEDASRAELAQRKESAADFQYFAQARVLGVKLRRRVAIAGMLQDANQAAGLVGVLDYALVVTTFGALVSVPDDLSRDFIRTTTPGPLRVRQRKYARREAAPAAVSRDPQADAFLGRTRGGVA